MSYNTTYRSNKHRPQMSLCHFSAASGAGYDPINNTVIATGSTAA